MVKVADSLDDALREAISALRPLAARAEVRDAYWISTPDGELLSDNGNEWCREHGMAKVRNLRRRDRRRRDDYILDGGWVSEHDTPPRCAHCGVRLRASLLSCGVMEEVDFFQEHPPRPGNADDAYALVEVLEGLFCAPAEDEELVREALGIARALAAAHKQTEPRHG